MLLDWNFVAYFPKRITLTQQFYEEKKNHHIWKYLRYHTLSRQTWFHSRAKQMIMWWNCPLFELCEKAVIATNAFSHNSNNGQFHHMIIFSALLWNHVCRLKVWYLRYCHMYNTWRFRGRIHLLAKITARKLSNMNECYTLYLTVS